MLNLISRKIAGNHQTHDTTLSTELRLLLQ